jgi:hypothetical protein
MKVIWAPVLLARASSFSGVAACADEAWTPPGPAAGVPRRPASMTLSK